MRGSDRAHYRSGETGLFVNSYLVEGANGVVAIDAPLLLSDGRAFRARLEALGKPLLGVLVTHPHPDHYNTITDLVAGEEVPVIAHHDVDREIRASDDSKRAQWGPMFGDEWPASATFPNRTVADEETVELGGLRFTAWDFGPCESERNRLAAGRRRYGLHRRPGVQRHALIPCGRAHGRLAASNRPCG